MKFKITALLILVFALSSMAVAGEKVIIMGYNDKSKMPLIGGQTNNDGLYKELFEKAAKAIGYQLKIIRQPKKRVHAGFKNGTLDFYPGASFSKNRSEYLTFLPNGLQKKEVLLSLLKYEEINDLSQVNGRLIVELGSTKTEWKKMYPNLKIVHMNKTSIETAIKMLRSGRGDFFTSEMFEIDYYKKLKSIKDMKSLGVRMHLHAFGKNSVPMTLGFSMKSKLFKGKPNPDFDGSQEITIKNFPINMSKDCVAYKFQAALKELYETGETQKLYDKYFVPSG